MNIFIDDSSDDDSGGNKDDNGSDDDCSYVHSSNDFLQNNHMKVQVEVY